MIIANSPPPKLSKRNLYEESPGSQRTAHVALSFGSFLLECLSRRWDKRYQFEQVELGLVIFDESEESLVYSTRTYTTEDMVEFKKFIISWKYLELKDGII